MYGIPYRCLLPLGVDGPARRRPLLLRDPRRPRLRALDGDLHGDGPGRGDRRGARRGRRARVPRDRRPRPRSGRSCSRAARSSSRSRRRWSRRPQVAGSRFEGRIRPRHGLDGDGRLSAPTRSPPRAAPCSSSRARPPTSPRSRRRSRAPAAGAAGTRRISGGRTRSRPRSGAFDARLGPARRRVQRRGHQRPAVRRRPAPRGDARGLGDGPRHERDEPVPRRAGGDRPDARPGTGRRRAREASLLLMSSVLARWPAAEHFGDPRLRGEQGRDRRPHAIGGGHLRA